MWKGCVFPVLMPIYISIRHMGPFRVLQLFPGWSKTIIVPIMHMGRHLALKIGTEGLNVEPIINLDYSCTRCCAEHTMQGFN